MVSLENKIVGTQYKFPAYWYVAHLDEFGKYDNAHWIGDSSSLTWFETLSYHQIKQIESTILENQTQEHQYLENICQDLFMHNLTNSVRNEQHANPLKVLQILLHKKKVAQFLL